ncbi:MBL fold metallo-hydrolase [Benzoatithermus flavus]|uniref:MBL fold metallo-hydrolase n=1 Tax=Benzoatithermus flavus TaxID=3108223 RepID=A0ABU8XW72_9PROT
MQRILVTACAVLLLLSGSPRGAAAAGCFPVADLAPRLVPAAWSTAVLPAGAVMRLTFLGHASFLIETAGGASVVTDYNGYVRAPFTPDIVTMNNAHGTHYTDLVEPGVKYVLRGWNPEGGEAHHDLTYRDLRVRNVPTAVHGRSGAQGNSNSIFVFEAGDLCVAHLGHLHQLLTARELAELGVIDVVLVPVDGTYTMSQEEMVEVVRAIGAPVVVPMHYFGSAVLARFLALVESERRIVESPTPELMLSRAMLSQKTVVVLPGR